MKLKEDATLKKRFLTEAIDFFGDIRKNLDRPPATAELLNWLLYMVMKEWIEKPNDSLYGKNVAEKIPATFSILAKTKGDLDKVKGHYQQRQNNSPRTRQ